MVYHKRFLLWWGLSLFLEKLGSRRQLDYQLNTDGPHVLDNLNRLAGTQQQSRPVNQTLNYFLGRTGAAPVAELRTQMVRRLRRMKALDAARLQGRHVAAIDGTGFLVERERHCEHCLTQRHGDTTRYLHQALSGQGARAGRHGLLGRDGVHRQPRHRRHASRGQRLLTASRTAS